MSVEVIQSGFRDLIDLNAQVRQLASGFRFTEGPVWHPNEQVLRFSDIPANQRWRWDGMNAELDFQPSNMGNGMTHDGDLNLIVCEHASSQLSLFRPDGTRQVLAAHFEGKELNSPNDVVVRSDGSIYFTDPWYGRMAQHYGVERPRELGWQGVFRLDSTQESGLKLVVGRDHFNQPNGLCFSPDEKQLYINDSEEMNIHVFDVKEDGTLSNPQVFAEGIIDEPFNGCPDGMKCDLLGNIWVTGPEGVWVFGPAGELLGKIKTPEYVANLHWGGEDWRTLFLCANTSLYSIETKTSPHIEPFMR